MARRGFTLIELLVAAALMTVLAGAGYAVVAAGSGAAVRVRARAAMAGEAQRAMAAVARDVRAAVTYGERSMTALDTALEGMDTDTLDFVVPCDGRRTQDDKSHAYWEIGYYVDSDPDTDAEGLVRRVDTSPDEDLLGGGAQRPLAESVRGFNVQFWDDGEWSAGREGSLKMPAAVRITLTVVDPLKQEPPLAFETTLPLPASNQ